MNKRRKPKALLGLILSGGLLFGGPCGITSLQLQDFITSALIRTGVTTAAAVIESAIIAAEAAPADEAAP